MKPGDRLYVEKIDDKADLLSDFNSAAAAAGLDGKFIVIGQAKMKSSGRTVAKIALAAGSKVSDALKPNEGLDEEQQETSKKLLKVLSHLSGEGYKLK